MRALVTGGTGFVGSALVRALLAEGVDVRVLVRPTSDRRVLEGLPVELAVGDVRLYDAVWRALRGCQVVYHAAAAYQLWGLPAATLRAIAVGGIENVLRASAALGTVDRIVLTSSCATVGSTPAPTQLLDESAPWHGARERYVLAKRAAEERALALARELDLPLVVVNPSGIFGPGDWKPTPTGAALLTFINGWVPASGPGGLNIVDVEDVARGHLAAAARGRPLERYILAGDNVTYSEFFHLLGDLTGLSAPRFVAPVAGAALYAFLAELSANFTGTPPLVTVRSVLEFGGRYQYFTNTRAETELGYTHRPAEEALARSIEYYLREGYVRPARRERLRLDLRLA